LEEIAAEYPTVADGKILLSEMLKTSADEMFLSYQTSVPLKLQHSLTVCLDQVLYANIKNSSSLADCMRLEENNCIVARRWLTVVPDRIELFLLFFFIKTSYFIKSKERFTHNSGKYIKKLR
jgi:hypothetical protein